MANTAHKLRMLENSVNSITDANTLSAVRYRLAIWAGHLQNMGQTSYKRTRTTIARLEELAQRYDALEEAIEEKARKLGFPGFRQDFFHSKGAQRAKG
jgi:anion-transporting  ArsA/GET3 family ATPase